MLQPKIGQVYMMYFEGSEHEQQGWRPAIVTQNDIGNMYSPNIIAVPLTSKNKKNLPTHVYLDAEKCGLKKNSIALCENLKPINKGCVGHYITTLPHDYMKEVGVACFLSTSLAQFVDIDTYEIVLQRLKNNNYVSA